MINAQSLLVLDKVSCTPMSLCYPCELHYQIWYVGNLMIVIHLLKFLKTSDLEEANSPGCRYLLEELLDVHA